MIETFEHRDLSIRIYERTFMDGYLHEQTLIYAGNCDTSQKLSNFVNGIYPIDEYSHLSINYRGVETEIIESIEIDGIMNWFIKPDNIQIKNFIEEGYDYQQLIVYVNLPNETGSDGGVLSLLQIIMEYLSYIGIGITFYTSLSFLRKKLVKPFMLKREIQRKDEWDIEVFKRTFEIDSYRDARYLLFVCGYKKDKKSKKFRNKYYRPKFTLLTEDGFDESQGVG